MAKAGQWTAVAGGVLLTAAAVLCWSAEGLWAQIKSERAIPAYQYVGVEQTIARVDVATGKIEILARPGEPRASLLTKGSKPWEWREVAVRDQRPPREDKAEPAAAQPKSPGSGQDEAGAPEQ